MEALLEKIQALKAEIATLQKSDSLTQEQIDNLNKAVISLREHKAKKDQAADKVVNDHIRGVASDADKQIQAAMQSGVSPDGELPKDEPKKRKLKLVKALEDAGFRESALLLKNWDEMDSIAKQLDNTIK
jgi:hypothetical protein